MLFAPHEVDLGSVKTDENSSTMWHLQILHMQHCTESRNVGQYNFQAALHADLNKIRAWVS